jgi:hypothetical protein
MADEADGATVLRGLLAAYAGVGGCWGLGSQCCMVRLSEQRRMGLWE